MAILGQALTAPESGWKRIDDSDVRILYTGNWQTYSMAGLYNGSYKYSTIMGNSIEFKFYGTKIRIIGASASDKSANINVILDGVINNISQYNSTTILQSLNFEATNLPLGIHTVKIINNTNSQVGFDAIDIDTGGYLNHPILTEKRKISDMEIGDCIPCTYYATTAGQIGTLYNFGNPADTMIPKEGPTATTSFGQFYFIKVDKGLLVADRVVQHSISWDTLNARGYIYGSTNGVKSTDILSVQRTPDFNLNAIYTYNGSKVKLVPSNPASNSQVNFMKSFTSGTTGFIVTNVIIKNLNLASNCGMQFYTNTAQRKSAVFVLHDNAIYNMTPTGQYPKIVDVASDDVSITLVTELSTSKAALIVNNKYFGIYDPTDVSSWYTYNYPTSYLILATQTPGLSVEADIVHWSTYNLSFNPISLPNNCKIRSLSGGSSYADINGNQNILVGPGEENCKGYPVDNEWDKYIVNGDLDGKIIKGDMNIWNSTIYSLCQDTPAINLHHMNPSTSTPVGSSQHRIARGRYTGINILNFVTSTVTDSVYGFRPVLEYKEDESSIW